jgi:hypothetical protein
MYKIYCDASLQSRRTVIAIVLVKNDVQILKIRRLLKNCNDSLAAEAFAIKLSIVMAKEILLDFGGTVNIYSDCQSIIEHLQGFNRKPRTVTFPLPTIKTPRIKLNWIPRELNLQADALAY